MNVTIDLSLEGMHCAGCVGRIERALRAVPGTTAVAVNLASARARVALDRSADVAALVAAVRAAGYGAAAIAPERQAPLPAVEPSWPVAASFVLALPLLVGMLHPAWSLPPAVQCAAATAVQFGIGARFYAGAWRALRAGAADMDVLVALGSTAAWGTSTFLLATGGDRAMHEASFASAALIIAFVGFGKWLESRARRRASGLLASLGALRPAVARVRRGGVLSTVPVGDLVVGDRVEVAAGERIPADGLIAQGRAAVDRSMLTGESVPVEQGPGEAVQAGALATDGTLIVETRAVGAETALARIVRRIEDAQASKAPVERLVDRIARVFVPVMLAVALATLLVRLAAGQQVVPALLDAVSVLVIACPCALGLATPVALVMGIGEAARHGILIKDAATLERARRVRTVAFDKTGTLTEGRPELVSLDAADPAAALGAALALGAGSRHPFAQAVRRAATGRPASSLEATDVRTLAGRGVVGTIDGVTMALGSVRLLREHGLQADGADALEAAGRSVSVLAELAPAAGVRALFGLADALRPEAALAVASLRSGGIATIMLTGDGARPAHAIAAAAGIETVLAGLLPEQKADRVTALRADGRAVAMVGDGINDGPALAAADLGIAMGQGTDLALEAADIALMRPDLRLVAAALDIARRTDGKIRQGLGWAFGYNLVCIPLAMAGVIGPALSGLLMAASSVAVVANALTLRWWRPA